MSNKQAKKVLNSISQKEVQIKSTTRITRTDKTEKTDHTKRILWAKLWGTWNSHGRNTREKVRQFLIKLNIYAPLTP